MYVDFDSSKVRLIIRAYFIISSAILAFIGGECCKNTVKVDLYHGDKVQLSRMTGWVSGFTFATSIWDLRKLPGGVFMGIVMFIGILLAPAADLAVSAFVKSVQVPSRCEFGQGIVLNTTGPFVTDGPPVNGKPKDVAMNAQSTSIANDGLQGIYWKVNSDPEFSAQAQDVLGGWVCAIVNGNRSYSNKMSTGLIMEDLVNSGYLYPNYYEISTDKTAGYDHLVAWSSSAGPADNIAWDVKLSIDTSALPKDDFVMQSFQCSVNNHAADYILSSIDSSWTLNDWLQGFQGGCYDGYGTPANADAGTFIEQYLNTMMMVEAGLNNLLQQPSNGSDPTQGCLITETDIPLAIFVLVGFAGFLVLIILVYWLVLLMILAHHQYWGKNKNMAERMPGYIPSGLTSWMLQAARESATHEDNVERPTDTVELEEWKYAITLGIGSVVKDKQDWLSRGSTGGGRTYMVVNEEQEQVR
jgi:hypothetical protein